MNMIRRSTGSEGRPTSSTFSFTTRGKKIWSAEEDAQLKQLVGTLGTANWTLIAESLPERTGKQCRERWHNHLGAGIKKGDWTQEEDKIIISMQKTIGNQWAKITRMLPGRTDNAVKNRFHATERAKTKTKGDDDNCDYHQQQQQQPSAVHTSQGGGGDPSNPECTFDVSAAPAMSPAEPSHARVMLAQLPQPPSAGVQHTGHVPAGPHHHQQQQCADGHVAPTGHSYFSGYGYPPQPMPPQALHAPAHSCVMMPAAPTAHQPQYTKQEAQGEEQEQQHHDYDECDSVTDLMDLDIISFGSDDLCLFDSFAAPVADHAPPSPPQHQHGGRPQKRPLFGFSLGSHRHQQHPHPQHRQQQHHDEDAASDHCCAYFDWAGGSSSSSRGHHSSSQHHQQQQQHSYGAAGESYSHSNNHQQQHHYASHQHGGGPPLPAHVQQFHQQQQQQQAARGGGGGYGCGADYSWGCTSYGQRGGASAHTLSPPQYHAHPHQQQQQPYPFHSGHQQQQQQHAPRHAALPVVGMAHFEQQHQHH